jgi:AcrR family transcriptional regulator
MKVRRTNQERSATTQAAILDATIGYGRTTTVEVAERAGVSRGALVHHFPTRSDLVLAALEYLCERRLTELEAGIARLSATAERPSAFVDLMWTTFEGPLFTAQLELWMAARADPELFDRLYPLERGFGKRLSELCAEALGDGSGPFFELTKHLMRGMAVERLLKADERERNDVLARWKAMATTTVPSTTRRRRRP